MIQKVWENSWELIDEAIMECILEYLNDYVPFVPASSVLAIDVVVNSNNVGGDDDKFTLIKQPW